MAATVGWIFVAIFAVLAAIVLLDVAGIRKIPDPAQRKWLFTGIIVAVVTAVVGLGTSYIKDQQPEPKPTSSATATPTPPPTPTTSPSLPLAGPTPLPPPPPLVPNCDKAPPAALLEWANATLGDRPNFRCVLNETYPSCAKELGSTAIGEVPAIEARDCGRQIETFRRNHVAPALAKKAIYQANLKTAEVSLRGTLDQQQSDQLDYIKAEISRMNGADWKKFSALDQKSLSDMAACNGNKCHPKHR